QMHYYQAQEDVGGMVRCVINLMEPLPPINLDDFRRSLENAWWKGFYGIKSKHAEWWERTSFRLWSALLLQVRMHRIPLPLNVLRMIRATLLYDTVAARIDPRIDVFKEYRIYQRDHAERVKARIQRSLWRQFFCGIDAENYLRARQLWDTGIILLHRLRSLLNKPLPNFKALIDKGFEVAILAIRWLYTAAAVTVMGFAVGAVVLRGRIHKPLEWDYPRLVMNVLRHDMAADTLQPSTKIFLVWMALMILITLKYVREIGFRIAELDIHAANRFP
ncbi:MAG TPA: hypothetical protein VN970_02120, partial [Thermoanaerobaculia bacterium]|nr:hypothetical protein [Thermoanaerobaculia bacterium]